MANLERIKTFDREEMFQFIRRVEDGEIDFAKTFCNMCPDNDGTDNCDNCVRAWLELDSTHPQGIDGILY